MRPRRETSKDPDLMNQNKHDDGIKEEEEEKPDPDFIDHDLHKNEVKEENHESVSGIQEENPDSEPRNRGPAGPRNQQVSAE